MLVTKFQFYMKIVHFVSKITKIYVHLTIDLSFYCDPNWIME